MNISWQGYQARRGTVLAVAVGILAVILAFILASAEAGVTTYGGVNRTINQRGALAAIDAVLSRREARLSQMARYGDAAKFKNWSNFEGQGDKDKDGKLMTGKNYGEDIVGRYRVRWKIEPIVVRTTDGNQYITNPSPDSMQLVEAGDANGVNKQANNSTTFMYRMAAEAILYQDPDHQTLVAPTSADVETNGTFLTQNPILARAQGVRFVGAVNSPVFRWVIFYAQSGPKGDLELTHGGTLNIKGDVHSNGAIYMGGSTQGMSWRTVNTAATTSETLIGAAPTSPTDVSNSNQRVTGIDGLFMLSKATMYSAINWRNFMLPESSSDLNWNADNQYCLDEHMPLVGAATIGEAFPLDVSLNYVPFQKFGSPKTVARATENGTKINPYRIRDSSGLIPQESTRKINDIIITGSTGGSGNDARDAFRAPSGLSWSSASGGAAYFNQKALTRETGARDVKLDNSLLGRPFEPQQLAYVDNPATVIDESQKEEYARPVFRDDGIIGGANGTSGKIIEAAGYYLSKAMGAGDKDATASCTRSSAAGFEMTNWILNAGASPQEKVGLIIRERYRPDFTIWGPDTGAKVVPANNPEYKPFAYGKQYRPVKPNSLVPVIVGLPEWTKGSESYTLADHEVHVNPAWTSLDESDGTVTVKVATAKGYSGVDSSTLLNKYTGTMFHSAPYQLINVGLAAVPMNAFSKVALKVKDCGTTPVQQQVGLRIIPGNLNSGFPKTVALKADIDASTETLTLDTIDGLKVGTLLIINNTELVNVQRIFPNIGLLANQVSVTRGLYHSTATAARAGSPINLAGDLPVACRLTRDANFTTLTTLEVDDVSKLSVNDTLRLLHAVIRITAINSVTKVLTVVNEAADNSLQLVGGEAKIGQPLHWAERCPTLAMLYSPSRGFFIQRRERPSAQVPGGNSQYWNGNGTAGVSPAAGTFTLSSTVAGDTTSADPAIATISCKQTKTQSDTFEIKYYDGNPLYDNDTPITFYGVTAESKTPAITLKKYGRKKTYKTAYTSLWMMWTLDCTLNTTTIPNNLGFWDPDNQSGNVGDRGKRLSLFSISGTSPRTTFFANPSYSFEIGSLTNEIGTNLGMYKSAQSSSARRINPIQRPPGPTLPYNGSVVYRGSSANNSSAVWKSQSQGSNDRGSGRVTSVWSSSTPSGCVPITLPFTITSADPAWNGTILKDGPPENEIEFESNELPSVPPTWVENLTLATVDEPESPFRALTGNSLNGTTQNAGFCVTRAPETIDINSYVTRTGKWGFGASTPSTTKLFLPLNSWGSSAPQSWSFRPDCWHGATATSAPTAGAAVRSVYTGGDNLACSDDIAITGSPTEIWLGMARVNAAGNVSKNPADTKVRFYKYAGTTAPPDLFIAANLVKDGPNNTGSPVEANLANLVLASPSINPASDTSPLLIGPSVQSGKLGSGGVSTVSFSNYTLTKCDDSTVTFDSSVGDWASMYTNYLRSQYQVFWGTQDITTDFFKYGEANDSGRIAREEWFFQTREFWSQSRWYNEEIQKPTKETFASKLDGAGSVAVDPATTTLLVEKDATGDPGSGPCVISSIPGSLDRKNYINLADTTNRRLLAKTTVLQIDMTKLQDFIKTHTLTRVGQPLLNNFNGLIYMARSNRMPWVPDLNWTLKSEVSNDVNSKFPLTNYGRGLMFDPVNRCWLSNYNDYGSGLTSIIPDNYDNLSTANCLLISNARAWPYDPWTCGPKCYQGPTTIVDGVTVMTPGTIKSDTIVTAANVNNFTEPTVSSLTPWNNITGMNDPIATKLIPDEPGYNDRITPRIKPQDFHHGFRLVNGTTIDFGYSAAPKFGESKLSICTPNQLYLKGDFNTTMFDVSVNNGINTERHLTPVAIMADVVTLQSNAWVDSKYRVDGLTANTTGVNASNVKTLSRRNGFTASDTTYNACIMTHNLPTTKESLRFNEASSFVNTMMHLEDWSTSTMYYTGSLVVMNSRRYSQAYLLETPKLNGRTPFGWAGWNARTDSLGTVPYNNRTCLPARYDASLLGTFVSGSGFLDWCYNNSSKRAGTDTTTGEMVPFDFPVIFKGNRFIADVDTDGIPPVYWQPNRVLTFNNDLITSEGTPTYTPFGQTITGLGSWSRIIE